MILPFAIHTVSLRTTIEGHFISTVEVRHERHMFC
jgi:hypothetical protein